MTAKTNKYFENRFKLKKHELLTKMQLIVVLHICEDMPDTAIAKTLKKHLRTIQSHKDVIRCKTGAKTNAGIILYAIRYCIFSPVILSSAAMYVVMNLPENVFYLSPLDMLLSA